MHPAKRPRDNPNKLESAIVNRYFLCTNMHIQINDVKAEPTVAPAAGCGVHVAAMGAFSAPLR